MGYRSKNEVDSWRKKCPLKYLKKLSINLNLRQESLRKIEQSIDNKIDHSYEEALKDDFPKFSEIKTYI